VDGTKLAYNRRRTLSIKHLATGGLALFLSLGLTTLIAQTENKERIARAYALGETRFYQDLSDFSKNLAWSAEDHKRLQNPEQEIPGLYQHLMNFYYILHPYPDLPEKSIESHFLEISERMAKEFVFSIPGTSSQPEISPLMSVLQSAGYYANMSVPHFRHLTRPMRRYVKTQWAMDDLKIKDVHSLSKGKGVRLAIIDTGIDPTLQPIRSRIKESKNLLDGSKLPGKKERYPYDWGGHGTSLATVIYEIAPDVELLIIKFFENESMGSAPTSRWTCYLVAAGMMWAVQNGADIINLSVSLGQDIEAVKEAARYCWDRNVVVVTSMGNIFGDKPQDTISYLAAYPWTIAVGGVEKVGQSLQVWEHSGSGGYIDVVAPAKDLHVEVPRYRGHPTPTPIRWGNSLATSFVAGATALILSSFPQETLSEFREEPGKVPETVRGILRATASNKILGYNEPNPYSGHGLIRVLAAVQKARITKIESR